MKIRVEKWFAWILAATQLARSEVGMAASRRPNVLFILGMALIAGGLCRSPGVETRASANRWENEIEQFEASDKTNPPPSRAILFIGSSSIRLWKNLPEYFPGQPVFSRGFGGSEMSDSVSFADRIVIPYEPRMVLVYAGDNDLANGKSPAQVLADFQAFVRKVHTALPQTLIGYIAIKPSLARRPLLPLIKAADHAIRQYARREQGVRFIDVFTPMLDRRGEPRADLFRQDGLHLNEKGYALWASIIGPMIRKSETPGRKDAGTAHPSQG